VPLATPYRPILFPKRNNGHLSYAGSSPRRSITSFASNARRADRHGVCKMRRDAEARGVSCELCALAVRLDSDGMETTCAF